MSFIIGMTIGYSCVELIQNEMEFYNQKSSKDKINNINIENDVLKLNEYIESFILENEINYETKNIIDNENKNEINYKNNNRINYGNKNTEWKIRIPKIGLEAKIENGTSKEILNEFVGHFEETSKLFGNIGLAAHNRGYNVNYFEKIKFLEIGDEIFYSYSGIEKRYIVISKNIIEDTNWKVLENTKDNRITLITCVENKPKNRLCLQGIEK